MQINSRELFSIDAPAARGSGGLDPVREQHERLPGGSDRALKFAGGSAERVRFQTEESAPLQELREPALGFKGNSTRFGVLRVLRGNADLVRVPEHMPVLDLQHFAEAATGLERADDSVAHRSAGERVFGAVEFVGGGKQPLLFIWRNATMRFVSPLVLILTPNLWNGDVVKIGGVRPRPQLIACRKMASVRFTEAVDFVSPYERLKSSIGSTRSSSETGSSPSEALSVARRLRIEATLLRDSATT